MARPIRLSVHARTVVTERNLDIDWIADAVRQPDWVQLDPTDPTVERRFGEIVAFGGRVLRVACRENETEVFVLSCFFDRGAKRPR